MPEPAVVADSGPLIALSLGQSLHLLRELYGTVLVPEAVWREVTEGGQGRAGAAEISTASWLERTTLGRSPDPLLRAELGPGEAEAITLAAERNGLLIVDERQARQVAEIAYGGRARLGGNPDFGEEAESGRGGSASPRAHATGWLLPGRRPDRIRLRIGGGEGPLAPVWRPHPPHPGGVVHVVSTGRQ
jgi:hypothetical protein